MAFLYTPSRTAMTKSPITAPERKWFENLMPDQRMNLVLRFSRRLRSLSRSMEAAGRPDMVPILVGVADNLDANADEIAAATVGIEVLARAAGLIQTAEDIVGDRAGPVTLH